jgi:Domain of unknown function (DUF1963)
VGVLAIVSMLVLASPAVAYGYRDAEVREAVAGAGFESSIADRAAAASLPTVLVGRRMLEAPPRTLGTSRLGGNPDLPVGARWPRCRGRAQTFLGQVRLSDLPTDAEPLRAHNGLLLLFTHVQMESPGYGLWAGRCTSVLHAPEGAKLVRKRPPRGASVLRLRAAQMRFRMRPDIPDVHPGLGHLAEPLSDIGLTDKEVERWWGLEKALHRRQKLLVHRLLGHIRTPNGETSCWGRTQRRRAAWRHLVTIGLDFGVGFEVADGGRLQVAIPPGDLRSGRFDRVCGVFDSA